MTACSMSAHDLEMDRYHRYKCVAADHTTEPCHGVIFQSVTTILNKAVPKNLSWHGQTRGVIGVKGLLRIPKYDVQAMRQGERAAACVAEGISIDGLTRTDWGPKGNPLNRLSAIPKYDIGTMTPDAITDALKREHLTVNDHRDQAAEGGTLVHKALEDYVREGVIPNASAVPESKRGSLIGLAKFIIDFKPVFIASEVRTLSVKHAYAGTFDLLCEIRARLDTLPVWEATGKGAASKSKARQLVLLPDPDNVLTALVDLKTSKWVYPSSHFPQLEGYEGARVECGEPATDVRAVLWLPADGDMQLVPSPSSFSDFLALKASADVQTRLDKTWRRPKKVRA